MKCPPIGRSFSIKKWQSSIALFACQKVDIELNRLSVYMLFGIVSPKFTFTACDRPELRRARVEPPGNDNKGRRPHHSSFINLDMLSKRPWFQNSVGSRKTPFSTTCCFNIRWKSPACQAAVRSRSLHPSPKVAAMGSGAERLPSTASTPPESRKEWL